MNQIASWIAYLAFTCWCRNRFYW